MARGVKRVSRVYEIADDYVEQFAALHPIAATGMGVSGYDDRLTDFSPAGHESRIDLDQKTLQKLEAIVVKEESERDRVAREAMAERLKLSLDLNDAGEHYRSLNILSSPLQSIRRVFDLMPRGTEEDWRSIAHRMVRVPESLGQFRETLEAGITRERVGTRRQVEACAQQAEIWSGHQADVTGFFRGLADDFEGSDMDVPSLAAVLQNAAGVAGGAYADFARYLRQYYLKNP